MHTHSHAHSHSHTQAHMRALASSRTPSQHHLSFWLDRRVVVVALLLQLSRKRSTRGEKTQPLFFFLFVFQSSLVDAEESESGKTKVPKKITRVHFRPSFRGREKKLKPKPNEFKQKFSRKSFFLLRWQTSDFFELWHHRPSEEGSLLELSSPVEKKKQQQLLLESERRRRSCSRNKIGENWKCLFNGLLQKTKTTTRSFVARAQDCHLWSTIRSHAQAHNC